MRLTKYEHASFVLNEDGKNLVVDPGAFTTPFLGLDDVVGIVVTHEHADHWTPDQFTHILDRNPGIPIFGPAGFAAAASGFDVTVVTPGETVTVGPFTLEFFGGKHAVIHSSIPVIDNVGVLINGTLFHPGDSFTVPGVPVDVLAVPSSGPWLKIAEVMDYVTAVKPKRAFPIHEMVNSTIGNGMARERIGAVTEAGGGEFFVLEPTEFREL